MGETWKLPLGVKLIIGFHLASFVILFFGQSLAVVAYDRVADWGLQEPSALLDPVIVQVNRSIGLTDTIIMLPLHAIAAAGLLQMRFYGAVASWLVFGMTMYWPLLFWTAQGFYAAAGTRHVPTSTMAIIVPAACMLIAIWGSWYLYRNRDLLR